MHPSIEPVGLDRGDSKRPDGMTVLPFSRESASFGILPVSTLFPPTLALTATEPGSASRSADVRKSLRYEKMKMKMCEF